MARKDFQDQLRGMSEKQPCGCPAAAAVRMLQGKWKLQLLYELCVQSPLRFGELRRKLGNVTNAALTHALRELEASGLISRVQYNEIPPHVEYALTKKGEALLPVFCELAEWGRTYLL